MSSRSFTPPKAIRSITSFCLPNIRAEYIVHSPHLSFMASSAFDTFLFRSRSVSNKLSCIEVASDKSKQDTSSVEFFNKLYLYQCPTYGTGLRRSMLGKLNAINKHKTKINWQFGTDLARVK